MECYILSYDGKSFLAFNSRRLLPKKYGGILQMLHPDSQPVLGSSRKRARKKQTRTVPCPEQGCTRMCRSQAELAIHRNSHTKVIEEPYMA